MWKMIWRTFRLTLYAPLDDGLTVPCGRCRLRHFVENAKQNAQICTMGAPQEHEDERIAINRARLDRIR